MPYTNQQLNDFVGQEVEALINKVRMGNSPQDINGVANHVVTRVVLGMLRPAGGWNYNSLSDVIKTLECSKLEIERRLVGPYEDFARSRNGDLPELEEARKEIMGKVVANAKPCQCSTGTDS